VLFAAVAMLVLQPSFAGAQVTVEGGATRAPDAVLVVDHNLVAKPEGKSATNALTTIYDNATSTAQFPVSSADLTVQWGDRLFTTGTGLLSTHKFTIFNSGSSAGNLVTCSVVVGFFDAATAAPLGSYGGNIDFGAGLPPSGYAIITASPLDAFLILLNTSDVVVIQQVTAKTGPANRLGIVSMGPILIGSSPTTMLVNGVAQSFASGAADPGHALAVNPPPVSTKSTTWGRVKNLYK
jgi:hypothetical protein